MTQTTDIQTERQTERESGEVVGGVVLDGPVTADDLILYPPVPSGSLISPSIFRTPPFTHEEIMLIILANNNSNANVNNNKIFCIGPVIK